MPKKIMVTLYYENSETARQDCDIIGIDRRRVTNIDRGYRRDFPVMCRKPVDGHMVEVKATHTIRVSDEVLRKVSIDKLHHIDDEADW